MWTLFYWNRSLLCIVNMSLLCSMQYSLVSLIPILESPGTSVKGIPPHASFVEGAGDHRPSIEMQCQCHTVENAFTGQDSGMMFKIGVKLVQLVPLERHLAQRDEHPWEPFKLVTQCRLLPLTSWAHYLRQRQIIPTSWLLEIIIPDGWRHMPSQIRRQWQLHRSL